MTCSNPAHYPAHALPSEYDAHHHCAGRVDVVDGRTVVVDATACELLCPCCGVSCRPALMGYCYPGGHERCFVCKDAGHDARCRATDAAQRLQEARQAAEGAGDDVEGG